MTRPENQIYESPNARLYSLDIISRLYRNLRDRSMFKRIQSEGKQLGLLSGRIITFTFFFF